MFRRLLVPLDGTPQSASALPAARVLARAFRGQLILVRVLEASANHEPVERLTEARRALEQLKRIAAELRPAGLEVDVWVRTGDLVSQVLDVAEVEHADSVVFAQHGSEWASAFRLVAESTLPVVVVRPGGRRLRRLRTLVVPLDGTLGGSRGLDEAVGLASPSGATLHLVRVVGPAETASIPAVQAPVEDLADRIRARGFETTPHVVVGQPAEQILAIAEQVEADLVLMSTTRGSIAEQVLRSATCPVLLVRHQAAADISEEAHSHA